MKRNEEKTLQSKVKENVKKAIKIKSLVISTVVVALTVMLVVVMASYNVSSSKETATAKKTTIATEIEEMNIDKGTDESTDESITLSEKEQNDVDATTKPINENKVVEKDTNSTTKSSVNPTEEKTTSTANVTTKNTTSSADTSNKSTDSNKSTSSSNSNSSTSSKSNGTTNSATNTTSKVWHEAVYKTIEHPAEYEKVWVVDKEAYTYEKPIYEKHGRTFCNDCGADVTDMNVLEQHILWAVNGENGHRKGSYHDKWVDILVGTETVTVPEEGHYEEKLVKKAWTEKVLLKEAGYY